MDLAQNKKDQQDLKRRISLYRQAAKMKMVEKLEKRLAALEKTSALPILHQFSTSSTTREAVIKLLHKQKSHVFLVVRDEFIGHLKAMEKEGHEEDRTFYLQAFDGNSTYSYNTIKHGLLVVPHNCIAMFGTLHPGTFHPYINAAVQGGKGDDGFVQRFQLLVWSAAEPGEEQEREPDQQAAEKAWEVFQYLADLDVNQLLELDRSQDIPGYRFTDKAQMIANKWRKFLKKRLGRKMMNEAFRAHLTKFLALMPSLALLFHLINIAGGAKSGKIPSACVKMAIGWCKVLESHARITYNLAQRPEILRAQKLLTALRENPPPKEITYNKAIEKYRSRVGDYHQTKEAFQELINRGYLYLLTMKAANGYQGGGKPSEYLILNPNLAEDIVTHYFQTTKGSSS